MAEETRLRKNSALQELKRIQEEDRAAGIQYEEPELKHFDAQSVFDMDTKEAKKNERRSAFHLGKRSQKAQQVAVHAQAFENEKFEVEDLSINPKPKKKKRKALKRHQAKTLEKQEDTEDNDPSLDAVQKEDTPVESEVQEDVSEEMDPSKESMNPLSEEGDLDAEQSLQEEEKVEDLSNENKEEQRNLEVQEEPHEEVSVEEPIQEIVNDEVEKPLVEEDASTLEKPLEKESEESTAQVAEEVEEKETVLETEEAAEDISKASIVIPAVQEIPLSEEQEIEDIPVIDADAEMNDLDEEEVPSEPVLEDPIVEPSIEMKESSISNEELMDDSSSLQSETIDQESSPQEFAVEDDFDDLHEDVTLAQELSDEEKLAALKARQAEELKKSLSGAVEQTTPIDTGDVQEVTSVDDLVRPIKPISFEHEQPAPVEEEKEQDNPKSVQEAFDEVRKGSEQLRSALEKRDIAEDRPIEEPEPSMESEDGVSLNPEEDPDDVIQIYDDDSQDLGGVVGPRNEDLPGGEDEEANSMDDNIQVEFYDEEAEIPKGSTQEADSDVEDLDALDDVTDLYEEKKRFLLSEYVIEQDYLEEQSQLGYHYVKREGKKFYFRKGDPKDYYYVINYYEVEPSAALKKQWSRDGWKLLSISPSKKKSDAGWFVLRNEEKTGEYRKKIENEEEKFNFFQKYRSSCRSTLFLIFICMVCCIITGGLQISYQGFLFGIAVCVVLFLFCLASFISYSRMLRGATKQANLLKARLRLKERRNNTIEDTSSVPDEILDSEWEKVNSEEK